MTKEMILDLIKRGEGVTIEFKECKNEVAAEVYPTVSIIGYDNILQPFEKWNNYKPSQSLSWWKSFTDIKHNRYNTRKEANLENTLSILGALYIINILFLKKVVENTEEFDVHDEPSRLFQLKNLETKFISLGGACIVEI